jgi:hypothetical protein
MMVPLHDKPIRLSLSLLIADEQLKTQVAQLLRGFGIDDLASPDETPAAVIGDSETEGASAPVIRLLRTPRHRRLCVGEANPFADPRVISWIGGIPEVDADGIWSTLDHLSSGRFLTLDHLLGPSAQIVSAYETSSAAKDRHTERMTEFFAPLELPEFLQIAMDVALDELFTNAVYNAPIDATGTRPNAAASRTLQVTSERPFVIRFGVDDDFVAVAVRDLYGSLPLPRIIERLRRCYSVGGATIENKEGGAGLGVFMLLQSATRLVINLKVGQFTEFIFMRRRHERRRSFMLSAPTLSLCAVEGAEAIRTSRAFPRIPVAWPAFVRHAGTETPGQILDVSSHGAFICPHERGWSFQAGDEIDLSLLAGADRRRLEVRAKVCWAGMSSEHICRGFGVKFAIPIDIRGCC